MSIDRELGYREAAYMGNPEALQKRAGITKELVDAMAAQKLFNEKQSAARQMQASMAQNPATVTEQLNEGLMNLTRQEVGNEINNRAQQIMGSMQQQQAQQQKAMQQLAAMAAKGGLGALTRGAQPQRPAQRAPMMSGVAGIPAPNMRMAQGGVVGYANGNLVSSTGPFATAGVQRLETPEGIENYELYKEAKQAAEDARTALGDAYGTPKDERTSAQTEAAEFLGRDAKRRAAIQRQLAQAKARQQSEEELARERRRALLLGMAGKTRGFTGAGASAAYRDVLDSQRSRGIEDLTAVQDLAREAEARDIEMGTDALKSGRTAEEQAARGLQALAQATSGFQQTAANVASDIRQREYLVADANQSAAIKAAEATALQAQNALDNERADVQQLQTYIKSARDQVAERTVEISQDPQYETLRSQLEAGRPVTVSNKSISSVKELNAHIRELAIADTYGSVEAYNDLQDRLNTAINKAVERIMAPKPKSRTLVPGT